MALIVIILPVIFKSDEIYLVMNIGIKFKVALSLRAISFRFFYRKNSIIQGTYINTNICVSYHYCPLQLLLFFLE